MQKVVYQNKQCIDGIGYAKFERFIEEILHGEIVWGHMNSARERNVYHLPEGLTLRTQYPCSTGKITATAFGGPEDSQKIAGLEAKLASFDPKTSPEMPGLRNIVTTTVRPDGEPISLLAKTTQGMMPPFPMSRKGRAE